MSTPMNGADVREEITYQQRGEPVFEVIIPATVACGVPLFHFRVWGDGHIEGFDKLGGGAAIVHNRFPMMMEQVITPIRDYVEDVVLEIDRIAPREDGGGE